MMWIVKRMDQGGGYVSDPNTNGTGKSYMKDLRKAKVFPSESAANAERCENEMVTTVEREMGR